MGSLLLGRGSGTQLIRRCVRSGDEFDRRLPNFVDVACAVLLTSRRHRSRPVGGDLQVLIE